MTHPDYGKDFKRRYDYMLGVAYHARGLVGPDAEDVVGESIAHLLERYGPDPGHRPLGQTGAITVRHRALDMFRHEDFVRRTEARHEQEVQTAVRNGFHNTPSPEGAVEEAEAVATYRALKAAVLVGSVKEWRALDDELLDLLYHEPEPTAREVIAPIAERYGRPFNTVKFLIVKLRHRLRAEWQRAQCVSPWRAI